MNAGAMLTATTDDGVVLSMPYKGWGQYLNANPRCIANRMSTRMAQEKKGHTMYTMRQVVGLDKLSNHSTSYDPLSDIKKQEKEQRDFDFAMKFLSKGLL